MAISADSYGSAEGVARLAPRWAAKATGLFDEGSPTTLAEVESWIDQVSSIVNVMLSNEGESVPQTNPTIVSMLDFFVNQEVTALVEGSHNAGRFGPQAKGSKSSNQKLIFQDAAEVVDRIVTKVKLNDMAVSTATTRTDGFSQ